MRRYIYFLLAFVLSASIASPALANMGHHMDKGELQSQIQTLDQAAAELRPTDAALADKLQAMSQTKQQWLNEKNDKKEDKRAADKSGY